MAKIVKPNVVRGQIFDQLAACFGESTLGMYDGKLRFEIMNDEGEVIQFSLAPVIHKSLVDETECDVLVPVAEQIAEYEAAVAAKNADAQAKKAATAAKKAGTKKASKKETADAPAISTDSISVAPAELTADEQAKLNDLASLLDGGTF
jgi:hypothetical protein